MERTAGGITYTLTRRRVRNINLRVRADGSVAASASPRVPAAYVDAFVTARADWVRTAQARAAARREQEAAEAPALPPKAEALAYMQENNADYAAAAAFVQADAALSGLPLCVTAAERLSQLGGESPAAMPQAGGGAVIPLAAALLICGALLGAAALKRKR